MAFNSKAGSFFSRRVATRPTGARVYLDRPRCYESGIHNTSHFTCAYGSHKTRYWENLNRKPHLIAMITTPKELFAPQHLEKLRRSKNSQSIGNQLNGRQVLFGTQLDPVISPHSGSGRPFGHVVSSPSAPCPLPGPRMCQRHQRPGSPLLSGRSCFVAITPLGVRAMPQKLPGVWAKPQFCHHPEV